MPNEQINNMLQNGFVIQSVLFDKKKYDLRQSRLILKQRGYYIPPKVDVTDKYIRYRMSDPQSLNTFKTFNVAPGIKVIVGKLVGTSHSSMIGKHPAEMNMIKDHEDRRNRHINTEYKETRRRTTHTANPYIPIDPAKRLRAQVSDFQRKQSQMQKKAFTEAGKRAIKSGTLQQRNPYGG